MDNIMMICQSNQSSATSPLFSTKVMLPKRRFWKVEQKMKSGFSKHFSMVS